MICSSPFQEDEKHMQDPSSRDRVREMAQRGLDIDLRKKFHGMEFRDVYELAAKVTEYEEMLKEESYQRKKSMGTYCQEVN